MAHMNIYLQKLTIFMFVFVLIDAYSVSLFHNNFDTLADSIESPPVVRLLRVATNTVRVENNGTKTSTFYNVTQSLRPTVKKWQVGRVSRKHYEIINMLWRKTNIFVDVDNTSQSDVTTQKMKAQRGTKVQQVYMQEPFKVSKPSTPSYIEFYYMDETVENVKHKDLQKFERHVETQVQKRKKPSSYENIDQFKSFSRSPFFAFHVNDPASALKRGSYVSHKKSHCYDVSSYTNKPLKKVTSSHIENVTTEDCVTKSFTKTSLPVKSNVTKEKDFALKLSVPFENITFKAKDKNILQENNYSKGPFHVTDSTTAYDKIKFFEVYDSDTDKPANVTRKTSQTEDNNEIAIEENGVDRYKKTLLEHVDQGMEHHNSVHKMRFAVNKDSSIEHGTDRTSNLNIHNSRQFTVNGTFTKQVPNNTKVTEILPKIFKLKHENVLNTDLNPNMSRLADWSEYPFVAVYVYERYQVHCDAAVISPHWLVASGSCLSRHSEKPGGGGRSAFVTYCGDSWWNPERIAYVKYSVVHPRYHPHDLFRRHLFNIGVIKVVSSMDTACTNWKPVSIMSHQFTASTEGSVASAVGWGLDRYDIKYTSTDLPRRPLSVYEGLVFSDSCPGDNGYRKSKYKQEEGIKNVYCVALPPYSVEENDPVHGGLLLVGGKLIALYLQEERRHWGDQSAQYTGIWKLVPWMLNVAQEPEEADFLL